jgi:uracil-DNA glycosylase
VIKEEKMSGNLSRYIDLDPEIREHMTSISTCRDANCLVPEEHPFYAVPDAPPFYYGMRPCMPVVPTRLRKGRVMVLGMYPTCRFASVPKLGGGWAREVPVRDVDEPFENSCYFDTYGARDVHSSTILYDEYLEPLGLSEEDLWITNLVKCFLFKDGHVNAYSEVGWNDPQVKATRDDFFKAARPCFQNHLTKEVELCQPKLIITMGSAVCQMVHADAQGNPEDFEVFRKVRGRPLRANSEDSSPYSRHESFKDKNVFCFFHPAYLSRSKTALETHRSQHVKEAKEFLENLLWD